MLGMEHRIAAAMTLIDAGSGTTCVLGSDNLRKQCRNRHLNSWNQNSNSRNRQRYGATLIGQDVTTPVPAFQLPEPATNLLNSALF